MGKEVMVERSKGIYPYDQIFKSAMRAQWKGKLETPTKLPIEIVLQVSKKR